MVGTTRLERAHKQLLFPKQAGCQLPYVPILLKMHNCIGRSGPVRTDDPQYPKLVRYHLRYTPR